MHCYMLPLWAFQFAGKPICGAPLSIAILELARNCKYQSHNQLQLNHGIKYIVPCFFESALTMSD